VIAHGARSAAARRPTPGQGAFLPDAGFVLEPDLQGARLGVVLSDGGEAVSEVFLNVSWAAASVLGWIGRGVRKDSFIRYKRSCMPVRL
jgi:hypothetical protein